MEDLTSKSFFTLKDFAHQALFNECQYVWEALGKIEAYLSAYQLGHIAVEVPDSCTLIRPELITIEEGTRIEGSAFIQGPCLIGKGCSIRHGAYIRGNVIVGDGCVLGHASELKNSILLNNAAAPHFNYVGDSILGNNTNLGAGFICSNYRLDGGVIKVYFNREKIDTGLKKFGIIVGDGCQLGCNGVSNPGTLLGKGTISRPCSNFGGVFKASSVIARRTS